MTRSIRRRLRALRRRMLDGVEEHSLAGAPVTPDAVVWAYRLFLDRDPENARVVEERVSQCSSLAELRREFLSSAEFVEAGNAVTTAALTGNEPPMQVQVDCSPAELQDLLDHVQDTWQHLGETEPHWSVLTFDRYLKSSIGATKASFYDSGRRDAARLVSALARQGLSAGRYRTCLDYGCGVARVSRFLAERFDTVHGYDISLPHLRVAEEYLAAENVDNVSLHHVRTIRDVQDLAKADVVYSMIALQHSPPPVIKLIIESFLRALSPGGVAYFQVPTYREGYVFDTRRYLSTTADSRSMEMHVLPQSAVFEIARRSACRVLEVLEDDKTGGRPGEVSNTFLIHKLE